MNTKMKENYRRALWSDDYDDFNDLEKEIWHLADLQHVKVHDGIGEFLVRTDWVDGLPPRWEDWPSPSPPSLLARAWMSAKEWILPALGIMGMLTLFFAGLFLLILIVRFVVG